MMKFTTIAAMLVLVTPIRVDADGLDATRAYRKTHGAAILREYAELLAIPNVASDKVNIRRNAAHIRDALVRRGVKAQLWELEGASPVVFGEWQVPGAVRTLGFYAHYDGQPVVESNWTHDPWQARLYTGPIEKGGVERAFPGPGEAAAPEWRLYARSAADDKAPIIALLAALDALRDAKMQPTVNVKLFVEGEEEAGSVHLPDYFSKYRDRLDVDAWIICDGPVHQSGTPQLVFGVRGITVLDVTVYGANRALHSGHYGNWAPDPAMRLARLLASMKDDTGRVLVEGFYDSVAKPTQALRDALKQLPDYDDQLRRSFALAATERNNAPYMEQMLQPALNVRGMAAASVGREARNVIAAQAEASIELRLVKGNDPDVMLDLLEAHIRGQGYHIVREDPDERTRLTYPRIAKLVRHRGYPAARTPLNLPICRKVVGVAERVAGEPVLQIPTLGGSLPLYLFERNLKRPFVIVPIVNHDNNQHAADENIRLGNLFYGIDLIGALLTMPD